MELDKRKENAIKHIADMLKLNHIDFTRDNPLIHEISYIGNYSIYVSVFEQHTGSRFSAYKTNKLRLTIKGLDCYRTITFPEGKNGFNFKKIFKRITEAIEYADRKYKMDVEESKNISKSEEIVYDLRVEFGPDSLDKIQLEHTKNPKLVNVSVDLNMTHEQAKKFIRMFNLL